MRRTARLPLPLLLIALVLAGCTPSEPMPTPPPTPSTAPVFASDEEALAAAEEAYGEYSAAVDAVINDGGVAPERIEPLVSSDIYEQEVAGYRDLAANGWHGTGTTTFDLQLQRYDDSVVTVYACDDVGGTDIVDSSGNSVVKDGRASVIPYEVDFDVKDSMRIVRKEIWGGEIC
jgi:hypothetical protein